MVMTLIRMLLLQTQKASSSSSSSSSSSAFSGLLRKLHHSNWRRSIQHKATPSSSSSSSSSSAFPIYASAFIFSVKSNVTSAENDSPVNGSVPESGNADYYLTNLRRIEDGSIVSNEHTVKWRIYTGNGRSFFLKGNLDEAEKFFNLALQEAKDGFGVRDAHVASSLNNLAELYRVKREHEKAEPLYLDAIEILRESFGPEDVRTGAAFHNLGQFYIGQRKLEEARNCYERALKIKRCILGDGHPDYADTMYHLGMVLHLLGKNEDSKALVEDSIKILEDAGLGESTTCIRRMKYLSQIQVSLNQLREAENVQRKILHVFELSKGWDSLDTINAAENLALTLQSLGNLNECQEILERCLEASECILGEDHIQVAACMLHLAKHSILCSKQMKKINTCDAIAELGKAKVLLENSLRITRLSVTSLKESKPEVTVSGASPVNIQKGRMTLIILLRSLDVKGLLELTRFELQQKENDMAIDSAAALRECISISKELSIWNLLDLPDVKSEYLSCLKNLLSIVEERTGNQMPHPIRELQDLKDEVRHIEAKLTSRKHQKLT